MRESDLRPVLLVKAIEEADADGTLLPSADRVAAAKEARREAPAHAALRLERGRLPAQAERLLVSRSRILLSQLRARHPFVEDIVSFAPGTTVALGICVAALAIGLALSALDGSQRINVLAFPLWGVVAWNLLVYVVVLAHAFRSAGRRARRWIPERVAALAMGRVSSAIARARRFHAPLAQALAKFLGEWQEAARPAMAARAAAMFHLAAAVLGAGLVAGFYARGIALDYRAGWESTFLDAGQARAVLRVLYGPASLVTGISIPDAAHLQAIRWRDGAGGEPAGSWIHLLAATALVLVIAPRAILAALAAFSAWRAARDAPLPASMPLYFDRIFREAGLTLAGGGTRVLPYAYEPPAASIERLRAQSAEASLDVLAPIAYGNEEAIEAAFSSGDAPAAYALLVTAAATPEEDSHGRALDAMREAARRTRVRVEAIVDEGPYAQRMGAELAARVEERRLAWKRLIEAHGVAPRFVDLSR